MATNGTINIADCGCDKTPKTIYEIRLAAWERIKENGHEAGDRPKDYTKEASDWFNFEKTNYGTEIDKLGSHVALTRGNAQGLYNRASEDSYAEGSPMYTKWYNPYSSKVGDRAVDQKLLDPEIPNESVFKTMPWMNWVEAMDANPPGQLERVIWMCDITSGDIYRIIFTKWTSGASGGGFAYRRQLVTRLISLQDSKFKSR